MRLLFILVLRALCVVSLASGVAAAQSLPAPTNPNLRYLGYYFADGRDGDFTSVVFPFTNLYIANPTAYNTANPDWQTPFRNSLQNAFNNGKAIQLLMADGVSGQQTFSWDAILDVARDFWSRVEIVEVLHEPPAGTPAAFIEGKINELKEKLNARSLAPRPVSVQFGASVPTDAITAPSLDIVGIEAYLAPPGHPDPAVNVTQLNALMDEGKNRVRNAGKKAILVMQAYDRNFTWTNIETLKALQVPVYLSAYNDPVVVAVTMFAYGRGGGTVAHPELETEHRRIAAAMGLTPPPGEMQPNSAVRGCSSWSWWNPVFQPNPGACGTYCAQNGAQACEWYVNGDCYVEFGEGCSVQGGFGGWYAAVFVPTTMQPNSAVRGCSNWSWWSPVFQPSASACRTYCAQNNADACEWHVSGDCYVEFGQGCFVQGGFANWHAVVLRP
jgi:hypothetical protein